MSEIAYCRDCGSAEPRDGRFCGNCGAILAITPPVPAPAPISHAASLGDQRVEVLPGHLASPGRRLAAACIDTLIVLLVGVLCLAFHFVGFPLQTDVSTNGEVLLAGLWLVFAIFYPLATLSRVGQHNGQTFGKQWVSVRAIRVSGAEIRIRDAVLRETFGRLFLNILCGLYGLVDCLWCLWDPSRQCLHDKIASTVVLRDGA